MNSGSVANDIFRLALNLSVDVLSLCCRGINPTVSEGSALNVAK